MLYLTAVVAALACAFASMVHAETAVVYLTEANFDTETRQHVWLIKFYAPWCGHCKKLAPIFEQLPSDPAIFDTHHRIGKVDCTQERTICERFGVQSYPTLKVIAEGRFYDYAGRRELPEMVKFLTLGYKTEFSERVMSSAELAEHKKLVAAEQAEAERVSSVVSIASSTFETLIKESPSPWILKFYAPWCGHCKRLAPMWHRLSKSLQDSGSETRVGKVDCTVHRRVCSRFSVNGYPTLLYIRDGTVYKYQGARSLEAFEEFVQSGWQTAEALGPIPDETLLSSAVDTVVEWAAEHTVLAVLAGILAIAMFVAVLVALLDYCLGDDEPHAYHRPRQAARDDAASGKSKAE